MDSGRAVSEDTAGGHSPASTRHAVLLWALALLFALRVLGQAIQHWSPQPFLPPFDDFQGSSLVYSWLLITQIVILVVMVRSCRRVSAGERYPSKQSVQFLAW